ncbi:zinc-binding protein A33-like [Pelodytes ibericus]
MESEVTLLSDLKFQLLNIKEESREMVEDIEHKMSQMQKEADQQTEIICESFQDLRHLLEKEENLCLAKHHDKKEKAMQMLESAVLDLIDMSSDITDLLESEKYMGNSCLKKKIRKFNAQLKTLSINDLVLDGYGSPLQFREWRGMRHVMKPMSEPLQFDPDSAHPNLVLSKDLRQVKYQNSSGKLQGSKECFEPGLYVLAIPGFQSGRHYWEVQVGNKSNWVIGIVRESVERKGVQELSPSNGYWVLRKQPDDKFYGVGVSPVCLNLKTAPLRIGVCLDFFSGHLGFYDADTTSLIFQFSDCPTEEKMFAFFCPGIPTEEEDWCSLTLCP